MTEKKFTEIEEYFYAVLVEATRDIWQRRTQKERQMLLQQIRRIVLSFRSGKMVRGTVKTFHDVVTSPSPEEFLSTMRYLLQRSIKLQQFSDAVGSLETALHLLQTRKVFRYRELEKLFARTRKQIYRWNKAGKLKKCKDGFRRADVLAFMKSNKEFKHIAEAHQHSKSKEKIIDSLYQKIEKKKEK